MQQATAGPVRPVFVLSLPRSGSTLVQRVLAAHPGVATTPEPWILLPLLYTRRRGSVLAEYDHDTLVGTLADLGARLPDGEAGLRVELAATARRLYAAAAAPDDRWFVDKTPRYHLIVDELVELFPDAVFIFVWRNPLAVAASMVRTWYGGRWFVNRHRIDLERGLPSLVAAAQRLGPAAIQVRYETLVTQPSAWTALTAALDLSFDGRVLDELDTHRIDGVAGDPKQGEAAGLTDGSLATWPDAFDSPVRRRWARAYLQRHGEQIVAAGYELADLERGLAQAPRGWENVPRDVWARLREGARSRILAYRRGRGASHEAG